MLGSTSIESTHNTTKNTHATVAQSMGAGLAAAHGDSSVVAPKATTPATPLTSVENVAPRTVHTTTAARTAATPLPPTSVPTANPRQHLADAHSSGATTPPNAPVRPHFHDGEQQHQQHAMHHATAAPHDAVTPLEQRLQVPETAPSQQLLSSSLHGHLVATPPPPSAEDCRPPPTVLDTAVKRQLESSGWEAAVAVSTAATNPNADVSNVAESEAGPTAFRRIPGDSEAEEAVSMVSDASDARGRGDHVETSPSPDVPEQADGEDVDGLRDATHQRQPQPQQQQAAAPIGSAALDGVGNLHDAMIYRPITRSASPGQALGQYDGLPLTSVQQVLEAKHKVYRICLTGGPCAGKSTMLSAMQAKIPQRTGFRVMCVPEAATLLVTGGMQWDGDLIVAQQSALLRTQLALEDQFYALAVASGLPTVIVSDRGTMDGRAFCSDAQFNEILRNIGSTVDVLRNRYDAVLHMVTAANGAEEFYNLDNPARYEDLDGARASDLRLQEMYVGHHMFRLLDNSTTFEEKIERGLQVVGQVVHKEQCAPSTPSYYLVRRCPQELPVASASYTTYTTVLNNSQMNDIRLLVKREMPDGSCMHFFKSVKDVVAGAAPRSSTSALSASRAMSNASNANANFSGNSRGASFRSSLVAAAGSHAHPFSAPSQQRIESAQRISSREYNKLMQHRDRARTEVVVQATHFIFDGANYELTTLLAPSWAAGRQTLTVESCSPGMQKGNASALRLPPFLEVDREVPVESLTTAFLISHKETGALYTSLAFAPVFSRAVVTALGAHADTQNILDSTMSTPRGPSALRADTSTLLASPVGTEKKNDVAPATAATQKEGEVALGAVPPSAVAPVTAEANPPPSVPAAPAVPVRRGLGSLNVNTVPTAGAGAAGSSTMSKSTPKKNVDARPQLEVPPYFLGGSVSVQQPRNVVTPSRFSLSGEEDREMEATKARPAATAAVAPAGEHPQPERRVLARDPEGILPPIESKKLHAH